MNKHLPRVCSFVVAAIVVAGLQPDANGLELYSNVNDGFLEVRDVLPPANPWPQVHPDTIAGLPNHNAGDAWRANVGEWFGAGLTTIVLPFQLPNLGAVSNPFTSADFGVMVYEIGGATVTDIDLYAVRTDSDPAILVSDWYIGSAIDSNATLIQESFLTPASSAGFVGAPNNSTDATGDANLLAYLNTAYDSGAAAGDYVFLRMSYSGDTFAAGYDAYKITVREASQQGEWPVISVTTNAVTGDVNGNGQIDEIVTGTDPSVCDFCAIRDNWLETNDSFGMQLARTDGDLNLDGTVSIADFREWKDAYLAVWGNEQAVLAAAASLGNVSVPEPSTLFTLGVGLVGIAFWRKRT